MTENNKGKTIFLSAAEPSGDGHLAGLITAMRESGGEFNFVGVGGEKMEAAGCKLLESTTEKAAMGVNAFAHVFRFFKLIIKIGRLFEKEKPQLVIVCDSPAFNFHVAKAAKKRGIKTLFYVAPQLWAWGGWRLKKLKGCCDKLACILDFEKEWFGSKGLDVVFVGNPLLDELDDDLDGFKKSYDDFDPAKVKIALMPGSRDAEIKTLWQPMQEIANKIKKKYPNASFTTVAVDEKRKEILRSCQILGFRCQYVIGSVNEVSVSSDFALVASGSATLQVAAAGCPMVIMYRSNRILWELLGRWLLKTKYLSLVNILAGRELVPEFMPYFNSIEPITEKVKELLADRDMLKQLSGELIELVKPLKNGKSAEKVAQIALEMLS